MKPLQSLQTNQFQNTLAWLKQPLLKGRISETKIRTCIPIVKGTNKYLGIVQKLTFPSFHFKFLLYTPNISLRTQDTQETLSPTSNGKVKTIVSLTFPQTLHKQNYSHTARGVPSDNGEIMTLGGRQLSQSSLELAHHSLAVKPVMEVEEVIMAF